PLVAALVDGGGGAAAVHVGDLVLLRHVALRLHQVRGVRPEQEVHFLTVDKTIGQGGRGGLRAGIVRQLWLELLLLAADVEPSLLVPLLEREIVAFLVEATNARLRSRQREGGADLDFRLCARRRGCDGGAANRRSRELRCRS